MKAGRQLLFLTVILSVTLAVGAGSAAGAPDDHCPATGQVVVGVANGEELEDSATLTEGSTFELVYCDDGTAHTNAWLDGTVDVFDIQESADAGEEGVYTVRLTGNGSGAINFADHVTLNEDEATGLSITVATSGTDGSALERINDSRVDDYLAAQEALANATAELDETTTALENGEADIAAAEEDLNELNDADETMTEREKALTESLLNRAEAGNASGAVGALAAVQTNASEQRNATASTLERYRGTVETERTEAQSTVRLLTLGSLAAGLVAGGVAGVVVPLVAARRVEETMKLSRNVSYDRKTALVPILVGLVLAIAGAALLAVVVDPSLLEVIR